MQREFRKESAGMSGRFRLTCSSSKDPGTQSAGPSRNPSGSRIQTASSKNSTLLRTNTVSICLRSAAKIVT